MRARPCDVDTCDLDTRKEGDSMTAFWILVIVTALLYLWGTGRLTLQ